MTAICKVLKKKYATKTQVNAYAKLVMVDLGVINVCRDSSTIQIVYLATVPHWEVCQRFATQPENVHAYQILPANSVHFAVPVTLHIRNVYVSHRIRSKSP